MLRLNELRKSYGMTQAKLASILGVARSTISMWEHGECQPDHEMLIKIADIFNVSVDCLLGNTPSIKKAPAEAGAISDAEKALYEAFNALPEEQQRQVIEYAEFLRHKQEAE